MELTIARLINLLLISLFVGTEFAIGFFVHPVLSKLPESVHVASVQKIGKMLGNVMPFWIPAIILSAMPVLYLTYHTQPSQFWITLAGVICIVVMLIISVAINVPINKRVIEWNPQSPPDNWTKLRNSWDKWHVVRIILDISALILFLLAALF